MANLNNRVLTFEEAFEWYWYELNTHELLKTSCNTEVYLKIRAAFKAGWEANALSEANARNT